MSKERELLERSIELIDQYWDDSKVGYPRDADNRKLFYEIEELLAQPEHIVDVTDKVKQEPVAWQFRTFHSEYTVCPGWDVWEDCTEPKFNNVSELITKGFYQVRKLYTAPPKREPFEPEERQRLSKAYSTRAEQVAFEEGIIFAEISYGITGGGE